MKTSELNEYARNSLTYGTLMLIGPSEAGKSNCVSKELAPFLKNIKPSASHRFHTILKSHD